MKRLFTLMLVAGLLLVLTNSEARRSPNETSVNEPITITIDKYGEIVPFDAMQIWNKQIKVMVLAPVDLSGGGTNPCGGVTNYAYNTENGKYYCVGQNYIYETSPPYGGCSHC